MCGWEQFEMWKMMMCQVVIGGCTGLVCGFNESNFYFIFLFFNLSWHAMSQYLILKKKKKTVSHVSIVHPSLNDKDYFDTRLKNWEPI